MSYWTTPKRKGCHGIAAAFERDAEEMRRLREENAMLLAESDAHGEIARQLRAECERLRAEVEASNKQESIMHAEWSRAMNTVELRAMTAEVTRLRALCLRLARALEKGAECSDIREENALIAEARAAGYGEGKEC